MLNYVQNNSKIYYLNPKIHYPQIQILRIHRNVYQNGNNNYFWVVGLLSSLCLSVSAEFFFYSMYVLLLHQNEIILENKALSLKKISIAWFNNYHTANSVKNKNGYNFNQNK